MNVDIGDVGVVIGQNTGQIRDHPGTIRDFGEKCVGGHGCDYEGYNLRA